mgnify:CR=1 FL=1
MGERKAIVRLILNPRNKAVVVLLAKTGLPVRETLEIKTDDQMVNEEFVRLYEPKNRNQAVVPIDREMFGRSCGTPTWITYNCLSLLL